MRYCMDSFLLPVRRHLCSILVSTFNIKMNWLSRPSGKLEGKQTYGDSFIVTHKILKLYEVWWVSSYESTVNVSCQKPKVNNILLSSSQQSVKIGSWILGLASLDFKCQLRMAFMATRISMPSGRARRISRNDCVYDQVIGSISSEVPPARLSRQAASGLQYLPP